MKIVEIDYDIDLFKQEYPLTLAECFMASGNSFFHKVCHVNSEKWIQQDKYLWTLDNHPIKGYHYGLGADVAAGLGLDSSAIQILCFESGEQVAEYDNDGIPPDHFADTIYEIGKEFYYPVAVIESNNHGAVTLDNLCTNTKYPPEMIYWDQKSMLNIVNAGHRTKGGDTGKVLDLGRLRGLLAQGRYTIHSNFLMGQCSTFGGDLKAQAGEKDDLVMALSKADIAIREVPNYIDLGEPGVSASDPIVSPFSFEVIYPENQWDGQPLASQASIIIN